MTNIFYVYCYFVETRYDKDHLGIKFQKLPIYIGKGKGLRMYKHLNKAKKTIKNERLLNKIRSLNFQVSIEKISTNMEEADAYNLEAGLIRDIGRIEDGGPLFNFIIDQRTYDHNRRRGYTLSEESRIKMSLAGKGRKKSEEHKKKISEAHKGKILKESTKKKLSEINTGRIVKEEIKIKCSLPGGRNGRSKNVVKKDLLGNIVKKYETTIIAAKENETNRHYMSKIIKYKRIFLNHYFEYE